MFIHEFIKKIQVRIQDDKELVEKANDLLECHQKAVEQAKLLGLKDGNDTKDENDGKFDDYQQLAFDSIVELLTVMRSQHHSGFSHSWCLNRFKRLAERLPLKPIEDKPEFWQDIGRDSLQHKIVTSVFKNKKTGRTHDIDSVVAIETREDGSEEAFTGSLTINSEHANVEFPYLPTMKTYLYVDKEHNIIKIEKHPL